MFHTRLHVPIPARKSPVPCSSPFIQHAASPHTPRCIGLRSTEHRLTLHVASPQAPRCINPPYSKSLFPPRVSRPSSPSCPVCCDSIATCPRFSSTSRLLPELPAHSRSVRLFPVLLPALLPVFPRPFLFPSRPVCCDSIATCPRFPPLPACCPLFQLFPPLSACLPICPRFLLLPSCLAWPEYRKSPPGLLSEGF